MTQSVCPYCRSAHEVSAIAGINTSEAPALKEKVRDGSLFIARCPSCGKTYLLDYPFLYHDPDLKVMIWLQGSGNEGADALKALGAAASSLDGYILRTVSSPGALIEKINIFETGLDDRAMELCKWVCSQEMEKEVQGMRFVRLEGADNEIVFSFALGSRMMSAKAGFNVYEDCRAILSRRGAGEGEDGFVSVDEGWVLENFR